MDYTTCRSLPAMFFETAERRADRQFLWAKLPEAKHDRAYRPVSWPDAAGQVVRLARGLMSLGIAPGDRVALSAESRPEWVIADLAIMSIGAVTVPAYTTNTADDHLHVLGNSGACAAIVSTPALAARVIPAAEQVPSVRAVVAIEPPGVASTSSVEMHSWGSLLADTGRAAANDVRARIAELSPQDTACLIYTSGTGGVP